MPPETGDLEELAFVLAIQWCLGTLGSSLLLLL